MSSSEVVAPIVRRSGRGADTRAKLVAAAKSVFEEHGLTDARVADMTQRAGVSYGSFYHYFESKEEVFREVALEVGQALTAGMDVILDRESTALPRQRLTEAVRIHLEAFRREAKFLSVLDHASRHDPTLRTFWTTTLQVGQKQTAFGVAQLQRQGRADTELDPDVASAALGAMIRRFADEWLVQGAVECDFDTGVQQVTLLILNALQIRDERPQS